MADDTPTFQNQDSGASATNSQAAPDDGSTPEDGNVPTDDNSTFENEPGATEATCQNSHGTNTGPTDDQGPIIMDFGSWGSLSSMYSLVVGVGPTAGTLTLPFTHLKFTPDRCVAAHYGGVDPSDKESFYNNSFTALQASDQQAFYAEQGGPGNISVYGVAVGGSGAGAFKAVQAELGDVLKKVGEKFASVMTGAGIDFAQKTQSANALLHGLNGRDTYNMDITELNNPNLNVFLIQLAGGCGVATAVNLLFIGPFPSLMQDIKSSLLNPSNWAGLLLSTSQTFLTIIANHYLNIINQSIGFVAVQDGAYGYIPPGVTLSVIYS